MTKKGEQWKGEVMDTSLPLKKRVETWLQHTGYPLEYRAAHLLRGRGFEPEQTYYLPGDEGRNGMEVDISASYLGPGPTGGAHFMLLCECKVIPAPRIWVAMGELVPNIPYFLNQQVPRTALAAAMEDDHEGAFGTGPFKGSDPAVVIRTALAEEKQNGVEDSDNASAFAATTQLVRRTIATLRGFDDRVGEDSVRAMVVPLLVVDGELARAHWDPTTLAFTAQPADAVWVYWGGHQGWNHPGFVLAVVKVDALDAFAQRLATWGNAWHAGMAQHSPDAIQRLRGVGQDGKPKRAPANPCYGAR